MEEGCKCQGCSKMFTVDLMVSNDLWEKIKPIDKPVGGGLLCPECVIKRLVLIQDGRFAAFKLEVM